MAALHRCPTQAPAWVGYCFSRFRITDRRRLCPGLGQCGMTNARARSVEFRIARTQAAVAAESWVGCLYEWSRRQPAAYLRAWRPESTGGPSISNMRRSAGVTIKYVSLAADRLSSSLEVLDGNHENSAQSRRCTGRRKRKIRRIDAAATDRHLPA